MKLLVLIIPFLLSSIFCSANLVAGLPDLPSVRTKKTGMLIGLQRGKFNGFELGMERQWKQLKLKKPFTFATAFTMEYQFQANAMGFKIGPWVKYGRADFTYGANFTYLSNFDENLFGISPHIGFKMLGFHVLASYNFMPNRSSFVDYNTLHLSLRYYISKSRKFKVKK